MGKILYLSLFLILLVFETGNAENKIGTDSPIISPVNTIPDTTNLQPVQSVIYAYCTEKQVNLRLQPNRSAPVIARVKKRASVQVLGQVNSDNTSLDGEIDSDAIFDFISAILVFVEISSIISFDVEIISDGMFDFISVNLVFEEISSDNTSDDEIVSDPIFDFISVEILSDFIDDD